MTTETIVLGGGCFWCTEAAYQRVKGVLKVTSGYAGGQTDSPSYYSLSGSGHAEVVKLEFDPKIISLKDILDIFWVIHDPTTPNQQGNDVGEQYRSIILWNDESQREIVQKSIMEAQKLWDRPIVTEVKKLDRFYAAEPEHQNFYERNPSQAYCQIIINPKLRKLQEKFAPKLK